MKKLTLLSTAAALALSLPFAANAIEVGAGIDASGVSKAMDVTAATASSADAVINELGANQAELDAIAQVDANTKVEVVSVGAMDGAEASAIADAVARHEADIGKLQAAIAAKADIKAKLDAQSVDIASIVAADLAADGTLVLYTRG